MATPELHELEPILSLSGFACCRSTWLGRLLTWYEVGYSGYCWWIERVGGSSDLETYQTIRNVKYLIFICRSIFLCVFRL